MRARRTEPVPARPVRPRAAVSPVPGGRRAAVAPVPGGHRAAVAPVPGGHRLAAFLTAVVVAAISVLFGATEPAAAAPTLQEQCSVQEWRDPGNFSRCVGQLHDLSQQRVQCLAAPIPEPPDSGMAGWFVTEPESSKLSGPQGLYSRYGYAGYDYTTYDIGCVPTLMHPDYKFENTIANAEFMFATGIIGASNALREKAWQPQSLWGWADTLVDKATKSIYKRVFTVFGAVTLAVVGLYLLWRSRQSDMNAAMTTAGWAVLVMVAVTAIAAWPVRSAHLADESLIQGLGVVHSAVGPQPKDIPPDKCVLPDPAACKDVRPPAVRASDTATETMLYRNWLRGALGSADSPTAQKYGPALYDAKALSWDEAERIRENPSTRDATIAQKQNQWMKVAEQIKTEDPQAYEYLQGTKGMDRIGAGFIAILSALFFAMFDITASVLVLLGFLIFRWAVVAAPVLGTVGMLRPASAGLRRLANSVIAAIFNIVIFGTGAAIYLFAVDLIMSSTALPGWLQVTLVWLCGVVGWLLLRPYRRITQLGGKDSAAAIATAGTWHRRFFRDLREAATLAIATPAVESVVDRRRQAASEVLRPEARAEDPIEARGARPESAAPRQRAATPQWVEADVPDAPAGYAVYRPKSPAAKPDKAPAARPESANVGG